MNFEQDIILACLEEDNTQRAFFRVHPMLSTSGNVRSEAVKSWPDEGCLRVVPDRNEQHTFKNRMRDLNGWCVIDLTAFSPDSNKIRTNKNYHPENGEINQYIIFSDAVKPVPDGIFFEVLSGSPEDAVKLSEKAVTPSFIIRNEDTFYGPVSRTSPAEPKAAEEMEAELFSLPCPDGIERTMLCIRSSNEKESALQAANKDEMPAKPVIKEPTPQPEPIIQPVEEAIPTGKALEILDTSKTFEETLEQLDQPLTQTANLLNQPHAETDSAYQDEEPVESVPSTATPLVRPLQKNGDVPGNRNRNQETISARWRSGKGDISVSPVPAGAVTKHVENPLENAIKAVEAAWDFPEVRQRLCAALMSINGFQEVLFSSTSRPSRGTRLMQDAMEKHLADLEAERLADLVERERAHADAAAYRSNAVASATAKLRKELDRLERKAADCRSTVDQLQQQINLQAAALSAEGSSIAIMPSTGICADMSEICSLTGLSRSAATVILTLIAQQNPIHIQHSRPQEAIHQLLTLADTLCWSTGVCEVMAGQTLTIGPSVPDPTPLISIVSGNNPLKWNGVTSISVADSLPVDDAVPSVPGHYLSMVPTGLRMESPISLEGVAQLFGHPAMSPEQAQDILSEAAELVGLSTIAKARMASFASLCSSQMPGGIPEAIDWALLLWVVPRSSGHRDSIKKLLTAHPLSAAAI